METVAIFAHGKACLQHLQEKPLAKIPEMLLILE